MICNDESNLFYSTKHIKCFLELEPNTNYKDNQIYHVVYVKKPITIFSPKCIPIHYFRIDLYISVGRRVTKPVSEQLLMKMTAVAQNFYFPDILFNFVLKGSVRLIGIKIRISN